jgi:hypothetical protein
MPVASPKLVVLWQHETPTGNRTKRWGSLWVGAGGFIGPERFGLPRRHGLLRPLIEKPSQ